MRKMIALLMMILLSFSVSAYDLSMYPGAFAKQGSVNAIVVVGNDAPASHVIAQTTIALFLNGRAGTQQQGVSKLSSEVDDLGQNIISIGNPCVNEVSARILETVGECAQGFEPGYAKIIVEESGGHIRIVAAGYTDKGTAAAANLLKADPTSQMKGKELTIIVDEPIKKETTLIEEVPHDITQEEQEETPIEDAIQEQPASSPEKSPSGQQEDAKDAAEPKEAKEGLFRRFVLWIQGIFG
jgi:hypothetical protein